MVKRFTINLQKEMVRHVCKKAAANNPNPETDYQAKNSRRQDLSMVHFLGTLETKCERCNQGSIANVRLLIDQNIPNEKSRFAKRILTSRE